MKKNILAILIILGLPLTILADDSAVLGTAPVQQEYQVATTPVAIAAPVAQPQPAQTVSSSSNSAGVDTSLQAQLSQLNQEILLYQQQSDQHIEALSSKNEILMSQLNNLNQVISALSQKVDILQHAEGQFNQSQNLSGHSTHSVLMRWQNWWLEFSEFNITDYVSFSFVIILLFSLGIGIVKFKRRYALITNQSALKNNNSAESDDTKDEYNFMSTNEAIPAILDLARAYVAMEDFAQAKIALQKVIAKGNDEQRNEAKSLLLKTENDTRQ